MKPPQSLLVANRGEIAARIFRTAREMGITTIAIYADFERGAAWTKLADEAYSLPGTTANQTYLNAPAIIEIAQRSHATAIHPGYGFLSEDPTFAQDVIDAGITWLGPDPQAIRLLGNKTQARRLAEKLGVNLIPGTHTPITCRQDIHDFGASAGYPILAKNPAGGGGRGIIELATPDNVDTLWLDHGLTDHEKLSPDHELSQFFLEKRLVGTRHIETQCVRDSYGNFWLASTRDCSVQRRHQKLIEEAPAPALPETTIASLSQWSEQLFDAVDYVGAGTCEFLVDADNVPYFLEVNPRLQVEHTVTEEVTGTDLVAIQILVAHGADLRQIAPVEQPTRGHSLQMRITSEDPGAQLMPSAGVVTHIQWPAGPGIRIDAGLTAGEDIPVAFDSLIAKIIVSAPTRGQLIARSLRALEELKIHGVPCSAPLYEYILKETEFGDPQGGQVHTRWLEETQLDKFGALYQPIAVQHDPKEADRAHAIGEFDIEVDGRRHRLRLPTSLLEVLAQAGPAETNSRTQVVRRGRRSSLHAESNSDPTTLVAPMQATVVRLAVSEGEYVSAGDVVAVVEVMKMEQPLVAGIVGVVSEIRVAVGDVVVAGQVLVKLDKRVEKDES